MPEFDLEERVAASPLVERIWRGRSEGGGSFLSRAASQWEMVVTHQRDRSTLTVRGSETATSHPWETTLAKDDGDKDLVRLADKEIRQ